MKEIPCHGLEVLRDAPIHQELEVYCKDYKAGAILWLAFGIIMGLPSIGIAIAIYLVLRMLVFGMLLALESGLSAFLSPIISLQVADLIASTFYWAGETFLFLPFALITFICLSVIYGSILRLVKKAPNVASKLVIASDTQEGWEAMCGNALVMVLFNIYRGFHDHSIGVLNPNARMDAMYRRMFPKGGMVAALPAYREPITSYCYDWSVDGRKDVTALVRVKDSGEYTVLLSFRRSGAFITPYPSAIAIFDKEHKEVVVGTINALCPQLLDEKPYVDDGYGT